MNEILKLKPELIERNNKEFNKSYINKIEKYKNFSDTNENETKKKNVLPQQYKRALYLSALNNGRIKKININKMNKYNILWNEETSKYIFKS